MGLGLGGALKTITQRNKNAEESLEPLRSLRLCGEIFGCGPAALWNRNYGAIRFHLLESWLSSNAPFLRVGACAGFEDEDAGFDLQCFHSKNNNTGRIFSHSIVSRNIRQFTSRT